MFVTVGRTCGAGSQFKVSASTEVAAEEATGAAIAHSVHPLLLALTSRAGSIESFVLLPRTSKGGKIIAF